MSLLFLRDAMTDADATALGSHTVSGRWSNSATFPNAVAVISSNRVRSNVADFGVFKSDAASVAGDVTATCIIDFKSLAGASAGWAWCVDDSNFFLVIYNVASSAYELYECVAGSFVGGTPVATWSHTPSIGTETVIFSVDTANTAHVSIDGTERLTHQNNSITGNKYFGLWFSGTTTGSTGVHLGELEAYTVTPPADSGGYALMFDGDSITSGLNLTRAQAFPALVAATKNTVAVFNYGVPSQEVATMATNGGLKDWIFSKLSAYQRRTACLLGGINDIYLGASAATVEGDLQTYWTDRRAAGWKVLGMTITPAATVTGGAETVRQAVNTWIRANHATYCDYFADLDADARLSDTGDSNFFQGDGVHPTADGQAVIAELVAAALPAITTPTAATIGNSVGNMLFLLRRRRRR